MSKENYNQIIGWFNQFNFEWLSRRLNTKELLIYDNDSIKIYYGSQSDLIFIIIEEEKYPAYESYKWEKISNYIQQFNINLKDVEISFWTNYKKLIMVQENELKNQIKLFQKWLDSFSQNENLFEKLMNTSYSTIDEKFEILNTEAFIIFQNDEICIKLNPRLKIFIIFDPSLKRLDLNHSRSNIYGIFDPLYGHFKSIYYLFNRIWINRGIPSQTLWESMQNILKDKKLSLDLKDIPNSRISGISYQVVIELTKWFIDITNNEFDRILYSTDRIQYKTDTDQFFIPTYKILFYFKDLWKVDIILDDLLPSDDYIIKKEVEYENPRVILEYSYIDDQLGEILDITLPIYQIIKTKYWDYINEIVLSKQLGNLIKENIQEIELRLKKDHGTFYISDSHIRDDFRTIQIPKIKDYPIKVDFPEDS